MTEIFGEFIEKKEGNGEYLKIGFSPHSIPLQQRWRNNGLSADFLAEYLIAFFPGEDSETSSRQLEIKDAISFVANELIENAMKFSFATSYQSVSIEMFLEADVISLYATNSLDPKKVEAFQQFLQRLLTEDPDALYLEQLERNAEPDHDDASGLGFLTILNDYSAKLAWKFEELDHSGNEITVTTMAQFTV